MQKHLVITAALLISAAMGMSVLYARTQTNSPSSVTAQAFQAQAASAKWTSLPVKAQPQGRLAGANKTAPFSLQNRYWNENKEATSQMNAVATQSKVYFDRAQELLKAGDLTGAGQTCKEGKRVMQGLPSMTADKLLGEIYLKSGQYQKALDSFYAPYRNSGFRGNSLPPEKSLGIALALCGMGEYERARQCNPEAVILRCTINGKAFDRRDLPGMDNPNSLKATLLLARAIDCQDEDKNAALDYLLEADRFVPNNPVIHYFWAEMLYSDDTLKLPATEQLARTRQAVAHYQFVAKRGHGEMVKFVTKQLYYATSRADVIKNMQAQQAKQPTGAQPQPTARP